MLLLINLIITLDFILLNLHFQINITPLLDNSHATVNQFSSLTDLNVKRLSQQKSAVFARLLKCFRSHYDNSVDYMRSLIWVYAVCFYTKRSSSDRAYISPS